MAISTRNVKKIEDGFKSIFPSSPIKRTGPKEDGGYETVSVNVDQVDKEQLSSLDVVACNVSNSFRMKRSGTGISVSFY